MPSENAKGEKTTPTLLSPSHFCPPHSLQNVSVVVVVTVVADGAVVFVGKEQFVYELDKNLCLL